MRKFVKPVPCYICGKIIPRNLAVPHHVRPQAAGGGDEDVVPLHSGCHDDMHKVANYLFSGKNNMAIETALSLYPHNRTAMTRMLDLAKEVAKWLRLKKDGFIKGKEVKNNVEVKLDLSPKERSALFTLAKDSNLSVRKFIKQLILRELRKKYRL